MVVWGDVKKDRNKVDFKDVILKLVRKSKDNQVTDKQTQTQKLKQLRKDKRERQRKEAL